MKFDNVEPSIKSEGKLVIVPLSNAEFEHLTMLLTEEEASLRMVGEAYLVLSKANLTAQQACQRRDQFCVELDQRHSLVGKKWLFNKERKCLEYEK